MPGMDQAPHHSDLYRVAPAARACGLAGTTLASAVDRGELPVYRLGDGLATVLLADVRAWASRRQERLLRRGPRPGTHPATSE